MNSQAAPLDKLKIAAKEASEKAYCPYSGAHVGAAVWSNGKIYSGHNVENSSYGLSTCAEQVAILKAISDGNRKLQHIYVYTKEGWPPCGICRQMMSEFASSDLIVTLGDAGGRELHYNFFKEILPLAFTPGHLEKI